MLLENRFVPITQAIGFIEAPFENVMAADLSWRSSIGKYAGHYLEGSLEERLFALLPLSGPLTKYLWVETRGRWTAYFDNSRIGSDPFGPISYLSEQMGCRGVILVSSPETSSNYGGVRFDLYGQRPTDFLNLTRSVSAINDGGQWVWDVIGEAQQFEETEHYQARKIRQRLTPETIERYARALGIDAFNARFYTTRGYIVEDRNITEPVMYEPLEEAQRRMGVKLSG